MKNIIRLTCFVFIFGLSASCSNSKKMVSDKVPRHFVIGSGGGFTGKYDIYKIHNDGRVEIMDASFKNYTPLKTLSLDSTVVYFEILDKLDLQSLIFNHPHNMTWFIEVNNGVDTNRVSWGDLSHPIRPDIDAFFKRVNNTIKTNLR